MNEVPLNPKVELDTIPSEKEKLSNIKRILKDFHEYISNKDNVVEDLTKMFIDLSNNKDESTQNLIQSIIDDLATEITDFEKQVGLFQYIELKDLLNILGNYRTLGKDIESYYAQTGIFTTPLLTLINEESKDPTLLITYSLPPVRRSNNASQQLEQSLITPIIDYQKQLVIREIVNLPNFYLPIEYIFMYYIQLQLGSMLEDRKLIVMTLPPMIDNQPVDINKKVNDYMNRFKKIDGKSFAKTTVIFLTKEKAVLNAIMNITLNLLSQTGLIRGKLITFSLYKEMKELELFIKGKLES